MNSLGANVGMATGLTTVLYLSVANIVCGTNDQLGGEHTLPPFSPAPPPLHPSAGSSYIVLHQSRTDISPLHLPPPPRNA